jgi:hypothetical protein
MSNHRIQPGACSAAVSPDNRASFVGSMLLLPRISMRADITFRNYRDTNGVKHPRRAARSGRT